MEKPFAFSWIYYQSETQEPFQYFNTNQSYWFKWKECVQSRNNIDKRGFWYVLDSTQPDRMTFWWKWIRHGIKGRFFFLEIFKTQFAFHLAEQQQQQQKKPRGHFSLCKAFFTDACLVVLGWLQGTDTAFIFWKFSTRSKWLLLIPGMSEARYVFQWFSVLSVCNVVCSGTCLAEDCLSHYIKPCKTIVLYVSKVSLAAVPVQCLRHNRCWMHVLRQKDLAITHKSRNVRKFLHRSLQQPPHKKRGPKFCPTAI